MAICVCGEGLVDLVPVSPGSLNNHVPALGGGPYNVAVTASRLGADVIFQSRLSTDGFGNELVKNLENEGVDTSYIQRGPEPTILAVTTIHEDRSATYTFYTEGTATPLVEPKLIDANIACFGTLSLGVGTRRQPVRGIAQAVRRQRHPGRAGSKYSPNICNRCTPRLPYGPAPLRQFVETIG